ncbi:hypothetical protein PINS_up015506 [Pythium insidiosum]|nr:hypothetical protein PINS_up015506 [Pythium insidiosum]
MIVRRQLSVFRTDDTKIYRVRQLASSAAIDDWDFMEADAVDTHFSGDEALIIPSGKILGSALVLREE